MRFHRGLGGWGDGGAGEEARGLGGSGARETVPLQAIVGIPQTSARTSGSLSLSPAATLGQPLPLSPDD